MIDSLLLDTNIITYFFSDTTWRELYLPIVRGKNLYISFVTIAELLESAYHRRWGVRKFHEFREKLAREYAIVPFCEDICDHFAWIRHERRNSPISVSDALIAATALAYNLPLVTHNKKDFYGIDGLNVISKYEAKNEA
ncbi:MAG: PIN domain-containing protein [Planctomycetaceae bacterium]|jgi:predicted nucleic acid-binding protein|nr:PIN domain-containing protein [Planctomycetaceae bacterium]